MPTIDQLQQQTDASNEEIKSSLQSNLNQASNLQSQLQKMQENLLNKKSPGWDDKKKLDDVARQEQELSEQMKQLQKQFDQNLDNQQQLQPQDQALAQKQQELKKLFDQALTPQMKRPDAKARFHAGFDEQRQNTPSTSKHTIK